MRVTRGPYFFMSLLTGHLIRECFPELRHHHHHLCLALVVFTTAGTTCNYVSLITWMFLASSTLSVGSMTPGTLGGLCIHHAAPSLDAQHADMTWVLNQLVEWRNEWLPAQVAQWNATTDATIHFLNVLCGSWQLWHYLQPKNLGQESYPINTEAGGTTCTEVALAVELRESVFTTNNFTVGFAAPAYEKTILELVLAKNITSLHKFETTKMSTLQP